MINFDAAPQAFAAEALLREHVGSTATDTLPDLGALNGLMLHAPVGLACGPVVDIAGGEVGLACTSCTGSCIQTASVLAIPCLVS